MFHKYPSYLIKCFQVQETVEGGCGGSGYGGGGGEFNINLA